MKMNTLNRNLTVLAIAILGLTMQTKAAIIGFEAESGTLGSEFVQEAAAAALGGLYITAPNDNPGDTPGSDAFTASYSLNVPFGTYDVYVRGVQNGSNDDSFYYAKAFGDADPTVQDDWQQMNGGFGLTSSFGWSNVLTSTVTSAGGSVNWEIGARENGFFIDAFALVTSGQSVTDTELDNVVVPPTITWIGTIGDWSTPGDWDQALTDNANMVIDKTNSEVTLDVSDTVNSVNVGDARESLLTITGETTTLTASSGVTVGSEGTIGGNGEIAGDLTLQAGAKLKIDGGTLSVTGSVSLDSTFGVDDLFADDWSMFSPGTYTLIDTTSTDFSTLNLENWGFAEAGLLGNGRLGYFQQGSLELVVIPEPSTAILAGLGLMGVCFRRRRRC